MATAYVLINCELGSEEAIIQQLKGLDGVREVHGTFGAGMTESLEMRNNSQFLNFFCFFISDKATGFLS